MIYKTLFLFFIVTCALAQELSIEKYIHASDISLEQSLKDKFTKDHRHYMGEEWFFTALPAWNPNIKDWTKVRSGTEINLEYALSPFIPNYVSADISTEEEKDVQNEQDQKSQEKLQENYMESMGEKKDSTFVTDFEIAYTILSSDIVDEKNAIEVKTRKKSSVGIMTGVFFYKKRVPSPWRFGMWGLYHQINSFKQGYDISYDWNAHVRIEKSQVVAHVSPFLDISYEVFSHTFVDSLSQLIVKTNNVLWAQLGVDFDLELLNQRKTIMGIRVGPAIWGNSELKNGQDQGQLSGINYTARLRQYLYRGIFLESFWSLSHLKGHSKLEETKYAFLLGYLF
ncbi:MAG: hypothetical protein KBD63_01255 [Bacteriovoracaceae bacterium]|nr:hypothetical protein [Bacteriovoracaceae bacterium]